MGFIRVVGFVWRQLELAFFGAWLRLRTFLYADGEKIWARIFKKRLLILPVSNLCPESLPFVLGTGIIALSVVATNVTTICFVFLNLLPKAKKERFESAPPTTRRNSRLWHCRALYSFSPPKTPSLFLALRALRAFFPCRWTVAVEFKSLQQQKNKAQTDWSVPYFWRRRRDLNLCAAVLFVLFVLIVGENGWFFSVFVLFVLFVWLIW